MGGDYNITEQELLTLVSILDSNLTDKEKAKNFNSICTYKKMEKIYVYRKKNDIEMDKNFKRVYYAYREYYFKDLFNDNNVSYGVSQKEINSRLEKISIIYEALISNKSDYEKISILFSLYPYLDEFKYNYSLLVNKGKNDLNLDVAREALDNFNFIYEEYLRYENEDKDFIKVKKRNKLINFLEKNGYLDNYEAAEFVIKTYLNEGKNYSINSFLNRLSIDRKDFGYCKELIQFLNPVLFEKFKECMELNEKESFNAAANTLKELSYAINNGVFHDGCKFNILEFYKRVPFKDSGADFFRNIMSFISKCDNLSEEEYRTIYRYLIENKINSIIFVSEEAMSKETKIVSGVNITPEINHIVFRYMEANGLPKVLRVYNIILRKYINNELDLTGLETKGKISDKGVQKIKIPYELIKCYK